MPEELDAQLNVKMPKRLLAALREIEDKQGISPADALRRLGDEMVSFYAKNGWFSFPVFILPEAEIARRVKPVSSSLDVWSLDSKHDYVITDDKIVEKVLLQLGLPNLFARAAEHDEVRMTVAFDNHPTHWLQFDYFKGSTAADGNGFCFSAYPKSSVTRNKMTEKLRAEAKKMSASGPINFSQVPMLEKRTAQHQLPVKA